MYRNVCENQVKFCSLNLNLIVCKHCCYDYYNMAAGMLMKTFCVCCRKLYWSDSNHGSLHVMELDGRFKKKLLTGAFTNGNDTYIISEPQAVAVNPKYGY